MPDTENREPLHVGFLLLDRFTLSAFSTFLDPLRLASDTDDKSRQVLIHWDVMTLDDRPVISSCGVEIQPTAKRRTVTNLHYLVVVGGLIDTGRRHEEDIARSLREADGNGVSVIGLCTGVFPMIQAGLLDGGTCCVNWFHHDDLMERFFEVVPDTANLYNLGTRHGTCAGGIGAACLSLKLIERHLGKRLADKAARILMVPDNLRAFPVQPHDHVFKGVSDALVRKALLVLEKNVSEQPTIEDVAEQAGTSSRQLERRFRKALGTTPMTALRRMKMLRAQKLLANTDMRVIDIGLECGYASASRFGAVFKEEVGETPLGFRQRYLAAAGEANVE